MVEKSNKYCNWVTNKFPKATKIYLLRDNWHPFHFSNKSDIKIFFIYNLYKNEEKFTQRGIFSNIKEFFQNPLKKIRNFFLNIYQKLKKIFSATISYINKQKKAKEKISQNIYSIELDDYCCLCGKRHDTDEDPLRLVKINYNIDHYGLFQPHYLFQYFLLKNLGVIPEIPNQHTFVHYKCAKSANPSKICPFTGIIIQEEETFSIGNIPISNRAREALLPTDQEKIHSIVSNIVEIMESFGIIYKGFLCVSLESIDEELTLPFSDPFYKNMKRDFTNISSHFHFYSLKKEALRGVLESEFIEKMEEDTIIQGIYMDPKASVYEIQICLMRYFSLNAAYNLFGNKDIYSLPIKIFTSWMEAELIKRISNNQIYYDYYLRKILSLDIQARSIADIIVRERKSHPVAAILSDKNYLLDEEFSENFQNNKVTIISYYFEETIHETTSTLDNDSIDKNPKVDEPDQEYEDHEDHEDHEEDIETEEPIDNEKKDIPSKVEEVQSEDENKKPKTRKKSKDKNQKKDIEDNQLSN